MPIRRGLAKLTRPGGHARRTTPTFPPQDLAPPLLKHRSVTRPPPEDLDPPTTRLGSPLQPARRVFFVCSIPLLALVLLGCGGPSEPGPDLSSATYGDAFWKAWGDGNAELSTYDLTYARYGEPRQGLAVAIFVTETFAVDPRVKSEDPRRAAADTFPVLKLNLVQDFATGIYDYNVMTSAFVALADSRAGGAGRPTKLSFSSQEWCGQVYSQLVMDTDSARFAGHSYFDGEADAAATIDWPRDGVAEDTLLVWARGLAAPLLQPGEERSVPLLRSLEVSRMEHHPLRWEPAMLSRASMTERIEVPAGQFEVVRYEARVAAPGGEPGRHWTLWVEVPPPQRVVVWERERGARAELVASRRLPYWKLNGTDGVRHLAELGLEPRPPRTP
jgi:hypothetical protein